MLNLYMDFVSQVFLQRPTCWSTLNLSNCSLNRTTDDPVTTLIVPVWFSILIRLNICSCHTAQSEIKYCMDVNIYLAKPIQV